MANHDLTKKKLHSLQSCKNRFCPMCAWRLAKKEALKISVLIKYVELEHKKDFIFLTLTAPNVIGSNLTDEITKFNKAFERLFKRKDIKAMNKGYIRKLEITYNKEMNTYHTHFHVLIAVNKSYFKDRTYIKQEKWLQMWRECMDNWNITQVDVRKLKRNAKSTEVSEIAKYSAKDSDYMINQEVFDTFYKTLRGRQILTYNGLFKDGNKLYKDKKLDRYKVIDDTKYVYFLLYRWGMGEYIEHEKSELTEEEKKKINRQLLIDEVEMD